MQTLQQLPQQRPTPQVHQSLQVEETIPKEDMEATMRMLMATYFVALRMRFAGRVHQALHLADSVYQNLQRMNIADIAFARNICDEFIPQCQKDISHHDVCV
jgi:hypothetical protein